MLTVHFRLPAAGDFQLPGQVLQNFSAYRVFYEAMRIFVRKHYGRNPFFSLLLRFGIAIRSFIAVIKKHRGAIALAAADALAIVITILLLSKWVYGAWFALPEIDYPWVFI